MNDDERSLNIILSINKIKLYIVFRLCINKHNQLEKIRRSKIISDLDKIDFLLLMLC